MTIGVWAMGTATKMATKMATTMQCPTTGLMPLVGRLSQRPGAVAKAIGGEACSAMESTTTMLRMKGIPARTKPRRRVLLSASPILVLAATPTSVLVELPLMYRLAVVSASVPTVTAKPTALSASTALTSLVLMWSPPTLMLQRHPLFLQRPIIQWCQRGQIWGSAATAAVSAEAVAAAAVAAAARKFPYPYTTKFRMMSPMLSLCRLLLRYQLVQWRRRQ
mmetsp:Transcript_49965/g.125896  ORF Transcript_49965/g.125896 Transcript_49965/m.125896 type:complete len:221 (+) Transcript_49965:1090-1752(+)